MPDDETLPEQDDELQAIDDDGSDVIDTPDGGAIVRLHDDEDGDTDDPEFDANLADGVIDDVELNRLATTLLDLIEKDKEARKRRDELQAEGLKRTGLSGEAPGGADFQGASKTTHPVLIEASVDFAARAMKEIFPVGGPVKDSIEGNITGRRLEKANRKTALMNWQLTKQCRDFRSELEQLMTQVPMGGVQYLKLSWDVRRNRPLPLFVAVDDMILPYAATNFYTSQRKTHVQYLTELDYRQRVADGMYRDVDLARVGMEVELSASGAVSDRIEGREQSSYNEDGLRTVYEVLVTMTIEGAGSDDPLPYIVTIDLATKTVLAVYRNWDEDDDTHEELSWFVEWPFVPWRGAYPIGLPHMIGGLAGAATGALRALLDSAHISNTPAGLKLKGAKIGGQTQSPRPGEVLTVEGGLNVDDIRKVYMPVPSSQPSPVLFQLLGFLVDTAKGVVRTTVEDLTDPGPNAPVGTTLARMEQGMVVYSSIHGRLHDAMTRLLMILHRLNGKYLDDERVKADVGVELAKREDFQGPIDVAPVSDPNIYSDAQRYAQTQAIAQRADTHPDLYDRRKVEERVLATLKIADPDELLLPAMQPKEQNAVNENVTAALGRPITAFPEQDHIAHLRTHIPFMTSQMFGGNPLITPAFLPAMVNHLKEHLLWAYASAVFDECNEATGRDIGDLMKEMMEDKDVEGRKHLDALLAEANGLALGKTTQELASILPVIQQAQKTLQQLQEQQMQQHMQIASQDPRIAADMQKANLQMQANQQSKAQDTQVKMAQLQQTGQQHAAEQQVKQTALQQQMALAAQHEQAESERTALKVHTDLIKNEQDNETAVNIASAEIAAGHRSNLSTGASLGEGE